MIHKQSLISGKDKTIPSPFKSKLLTQDSSDSQTQRKRKYTLNEIQAAHLKYVRILIPFDLDLKKFFLPAEELEMYDTKDYIQSTIDKFNNLNEFHIHEDYETRGVSLAVAWTIFLLIHIILGYLNFCLWTMTFCNILVFIALAKFQLIVHVCISEKFKNISNKIQLTRIKAILEKESTSEYCRSRSYVWALGEMGYWLEIRKG